jgi:hypothetical protein
MLNSKMTNLDPRKLRILSDAILDSNPEILAAYLLRYPNGAVIAESVRSEFNRSLSGLSQTANGMAPQWDIVAFNLMQRLDSFRSKARYLAIGRDDLKGLIFPVPPSESTYIVLTLAKTANLDEIYESVIELAKNSLS